MALAKIINGEPVELISGVDVETDGGVTSFASVCLWSDDDLAEAGLFRVIEPEPPEPGQVITATALELDGEAVRRVATYGPAPVVRREIPKSVIQARLIAAGKMDVVFAALISSPADFAKWFAPDWPNVFVDDERMIDVLTAVGADVSAITAA